MILHIQYEIQIKNWIKADLDRSTALELAFELGLNDWCLAAGFVRNLVWDRLHGKTFTTPLSDVDLIYYNAGDYSEKTDRQYEDYLTSRSLFPWSVKNQARMHKRNMDPPYKSTLDAMSYWVEVETAVGIRLSRSLDLEVVAPFGVESLFQNTITINNKRRKPETFEARIKSKKWLENWPGLRVDAK